MKNKGIRKKASKRTKITIIVFLVIGMAFAGVSHIVYNRSIYASLAEIGIKMANNNELASVKDATKKLEAKEQQDETPYKLDKYRYKNNPQLTEMGGSQVITFGNKEKAKYKILYLHGGAYVNQITDFHTVFCDNMAGELNAYVIVPLYPLAPKHTYQETYKLLDIIYERELSDGQFTIMGDSAGGGLSLSYCQYLLKEGKKQPLHIIAFSPWVDVSMTLSDYEPYEDSDPMLEVPGTVVMGQAWAGDTDTKNYMVSPYYGDVKGLADTTMFVGTREILYPDIIKMQEKLERSGVKSTLHIGEGMNHIYPIYPIIPEAKEARRAAFNVITGETK